MSQQTPPPQLPWKSETEFYDMHAERIFSRFRFYHLGMIGLTDKEFLVHVLRKLGLTQGSRVIDLGCGSGYLTGHIARLCQAVGISTSPASIEGARQRHPHARFEVANMEEFVLEGATHVIAFESMGYADAGKTLKAIARSLVPGGIFYFKELFRQHHESPEQKANREYWEYYWNYTGRLVPDFIALAYETGFELREFSNLSGRFNSHNFRDSLAYNLAPYTLPYPDVQDYIVPVEFVFVKRQSDQ